MSDERISAHEWIEQAKSGDVAALELLLLRYYERLLQYVRNQFSESDIRRRDAEDIVQLTHERVFRSIGSLRGSTPEEFCGWLFRICKNVLNDARRSQNSGKRSGYRTRNSSEQSTELLAELRDDVLSPSSAAISREESEQLQSALAHLSESEQHLIRMRYIEQRTLGDIAEEEGVSPSTIIRRCESTIRRIRGLINVSPKA